MLQTLRTSKHAYSYQSQDSAYSPGAPLLVKTVLEKPIGRRSHTSKIHQPELSYKVIQADSEFCAR